MVSHPLVSHPFFARQYARAAPRLEPLGMAEHRRRLLAGLSGSGLEIGAGNGLNFPHYPDAVTHVRAIEPDPHLRRLASAAAPLRVSVVDGVGEDLPFDDDSQDFVVVTFVLCSVRDPARVLQEGRRVLRDTGVLAFLEHVAADGGPLRRWQHVVEPVWRLAAGNCHLTRRTEAAIEAAGFSVDRCDRFSFATNRADRVASPHVLGWARK